MSHIVQRINQTNPLKILRAIARITEVLPLEEAASGDVDAVWLAVESGETVIDDSFIQACELGHAEIVRLFLDLPLERGVNPAASKNAALRCACENGHTEIVRLLLELPPERGVDPSARDNEALIYACCSGHTEIVRMLLDLPLERGVTANDNVALRCASRNGCTEVVRPRFAVGKRCSADDNGALRHASDRGRTDIVRMLLDLPPERGVDPMY